MFTCAILLLLEMLLGRGAWAQAPPPAPARPFLASYEVSATGEHTVVFAADDPFRVIWSGINAATPCPAGSGFVAYEDPAGVARLVPDCAVHLASVVRALWRTYDQGGFGLADFSRAAPLDFELKPTLNSNALGLACGRWDGVNCEPYNVGPPRSRLRWIEIRDKQSQDWLATTVAHELWHQAQLSNRIAGRSDVAGNILLEGTAVCAEDLDVSVPSYAPASLTGRGPPVRLTNANIYARFWPYWVDSGRRGLMNPAPSDIYYRYGSAYLLKRAIEGGAGVQAVAQVEALARALRAAWAHRSKVDQIPWDVELAVLAALNQYPGSAAPDTHSDAHRRFREAWADLMAAQAAQTTPDLGYRDDLFSTRQLVMVQRVDQPASALSAISATPPVIEKTQARDAGERCRRLLTIGANQVSTTSFGWVLIPRNQPPSAGRLHLCGSSSLPEPDWLSTGIVLLQRGGGVSTRNGATFTRIQPEADSGTRSARYWAVEVPQPGAYTAVWTGHALLDPNNVARVISPIEGWIYGVSLQSQLDNGRNVIVRRTDAAGQGATEPVYPGSTVYLEIVTNAPMHIGSPVEGTAIQERDRTLRVDLLDAAGRRTTAGLTQEILAGRAPASPLMGPWRYRAKLTLEPTFEPGTYTVNWWGNGLLRLDASDRIDDKSYPLVVNPIVPRLAAIKVSDALGEVYTWTLPPAAPAAGLPPLPNLAPGAAKASQTRPIERGPLRVHLTFDQPMDQTQTPLTLASIDGSSGALALNGQWETTHEYEARAELPTGSGLSPLLGRWGLSVSGTTTKGGVFDSDPVAGGPQPDTSHAVVIGAVPLILVNATVNGGDTYGGEWQGSDPTDSLADWSEAATSKVKRTLTTGRGRPLPTEYPSLLTLYFSRALSGPPTVTVGGVSVVMYPRGTNTIWSADLDPAQVLPGAAQTLVISLAATDEQSRPLDRDPGTVAGIDPSVAGGWSRYETTNSPRACTAEDCWHEIGVPVARSLVLVLDNSNSMRDNGQFEPARQRLKRVLTAVGAETETALVYFSGRCGVGSVPFTRDRSLILAALDALSPNSGTPLAAAIREARRLLADGLSSRTVNGRALIESDGDEQCGGDPAREMAALNDLLRRRSRVTLPLMDPKTPPPPPAPPPCSPSSETRFQVVVSGPEQIPDLWLHELRYSLRPQADGTCIAELSRMVFGVGYILGLQAPDSQPRVTWIVSKKPASMESNSAVVKTADEAEEAGRRAREVLWGGTDMNTARRYISATLERLAGR